MGEYFLINFIHTANFDFQVRGCWRNLLLYKVFVVKFQYFKQFVINQHVDTCL